MEQYKSLGEWRPRTSTLTRKRPERGEELKILDGNSDEWYAPSNHEEDSTRDDEEAGNDFWTITGDFIYRHHVVPREWNCTCRKNHFLFW